MRERNRYWLDEPRNVTRIFYSLCAVCAALVIVDPFLHKHVDFFWERFTGFHGLFGFVGCVFLVLAAKRLRRVLMRGEDFYD